MVLAIMAVYVNSLRAPFVFDDIPSIPENPTIQRLWPIIVPLSPPRSGETVTGRPLLNFSFALNHAFTGTAAAGYRATNIAIHAFSALLVFGLIRRTLQRAPLNRFANGVEWRLAFTIAALWALHPLQTQSVTYIVQRAESLMAFFYLLTLYAFARGVRQTERSTRWFAVSVAGCLCGMATKEVMVSAPVIVALYDRAFCAMSWQEMVQRRGRYYVALAATWILLAWLVIGADSRGGSTGFARISWWSYLATQPHAIASYLRLIFWPRPLVFDYGAEWVTRASQVIPYLLLLAGLIAGTALAFFRRHPVFFPAIWFFAVLSATSLVPGSRQTMAEQRLYLAALPVIALVVVTVHRLVGQRAMIGWAVIAVVLGTLTVQRNRDYQAALTIWEDTVEKRPNNRWARMNFGNLLAEANRPEEALQNYEISQRLDPSDPMVHYNIGNAYVQLWRLPEAIDEFRTALRLDESYTAARNNLADALFRTGRAAEAVAEYRALIASGAGSAEIHYNLGNALIHAGEPEAAVTELNKALELRPDYAEAAFNLGALLLQVGRPMEAVPQFEQAIRVKPNDADAHISLAGALAQMGRANDAIREAREGVRIDPANVRGHYTLSQLFLFLGLRADALAALRTALELDPQNAVLRQEIEALQRSDVR